MARIVQNANTLTSPVWAADFMSRDHLVPGGARVDSAQWATVTHTITTTGATAGATSIPVTATTVALPSGTILNWTGAGEFSVLTADAASGATSLTVEALDATIENADTATYVVTDAVPVTIPSGTLIGRTHTERLAGTNFGPAASTDDEFYIVPFTVYSAGINPDVELYRPHSVVKENFLPGFSSLSAGMLTKLRATYLCQTGQG